MRSIDHAGYPFALTKPDDGMEQVFLEQSQSAMCQPTNDSNSRYDPKHTSLIMPNNPSSTDSEYKES